MVMEVERWASLGIPKGLCLPFPSNHIGFIESSGHISTVWTGPSEPFGVTELDRGVRSLILGCFARALAICTVFSCARFTRSHMVLMPRRNKKHSKGAKAVPSAFCKKATRCASSGSRTQTKPDPCMLVARFRVEVKKKDLLQKDWFCELFWDWVFPSVLDILGTL